MNKLVILPLALVFLIISCKPETSTSLSEIIIDPAQALEVYDLASDVETEFDILPLETTDSCLIGNIVRIEHINGMYYVLDDNSIIYKFNPEGKYLSKLDKKGRGPEQYLSIRDFAVVGDSIWIFDGMSFKLSCFDKNSNKIKDIQTNTIITGIAHAGDYVYGGGNWFGYKDENFQIVRYNLINGEMEKLLPYPKQAYDYVNVGIQYQLAPLENSCLFTQSYCDTIFQLNEKGIAPCYRYRFTKQFTNKRFSNEEFIKERSNPTGLIMGVNSIFQTPASVIIMFVEGNEGKLAIYNKKEKKCRLCSVQFINSDLGNLKTMGPRFTSNGELMTIYPTDSFINYSKELFDKDKIRDIAAKDKIEKVIANLSEEGNPVIFRYKLKKDSKL